MYQRAADTRRRAKQANRGWEGPCEAGVGVNDDFGTPLIQVCRQPGKWFTGGFAFGLVLCPEHESLKERVEELAMHVEQVRAKKRGKTDG